MGMFERLTLAQKYIMQHYLFQNTDNPCTEVYSVFTEQNHPFSFAVEFDAAGLEEYGWSAAHRCPVCKQPRESDENGIVQCCKLPECVSVREFLGIQCSAHSSANVTLKGGQPFSARRSELMRLYHKEYRVVKHLLCDIPLNILKDFMEYRTKVEPLKQQKKLVTSALVQMQHHLKEMKK